MFESYVLKKGENLYTVADKFHTTVKTLQDLNNIFYIDDIKENREIVVPVQSKDYFNYYVVEKGDSLYRIAQRYNINPELLASLNGLNMEDYIYPNQQILIPRGDYSYYITKDGDTIDEVVNIFKSSKDKFLEENDVIYLMAGQILVNKK